MYRFQWPTDPNHYYILHIYIYSRKNTRKPMFRMYILVQTYVTVYTYLFSPVKKICLPILSSCSDRYIY